MVDVGRLARHQRRVVVSLRRRTGLRGAGGGAYVVLGELDLDGLGVRVDGPLGVQGGVSVVEPGLQLRQGVLELTQGQQRALQLVL